MQTEEQYRDRLAADPTDAEALHRLAIIRLRGGGGPEALLLMKRALAMEPDSPFLHNTIGTVYHFAGRIGEAVAHYQRAIVLDPSYKPASENLTRSLPRADEHQRAETRYDVDRLDEAEAGRKKVLVVSHERSGTHFLINTIAYNFGYVCVHLDVDDAPQGALTLPFDMSRFVERYRGEAVANVFKSHHAFDFYAGLIEEVGRQFHIFYIHRDGRDTLTSMWRYNRDLPEEIGTIVTGSAGQFLRAAPSGEALRYQKQTIPNMALRWARHVDGWLDRDGVTLIGYEELYADFDNVVARIGGVLSRSPARTVRPSLSFPSVMPWKGKPGNWSEYLDGDDLAYFASQAGAAMARLGYEI